MDAAARLSVAPMMDWTDRHCRAFHRTLSRRTLLYTEMVTAAALVRGGARHLIAFGEAEQPVALQLGGADPGELAQAARMAEQEGYREVNLNVGCPSDRVQSGCFGAVLMERPALVAECVAAMRAATTLPVTVKCRIGVDAQEPADILPDFLCQIRAAGVRRVTIHARKAWLQGLSPKENRDVPPLDYPLVHAMKRAFPDLHVSINGGIDSLDATLAQLAPGDDGVSLDGAMIGRAAYQRPADILLRADSRVFGADDPLDAPEDAVEAMRPYIAAELGAGQRLHAITRHMLGLFSGRPGARGWRRVLSEGATRPGAGLEVLDAALAEVMAAGAAREAAE
ncbi:tRNA dihydrouridine(20/20a) synthase DusA [Rhodovulum sp. 12E13]|uniref:tRNA dihydrouridine(20/20a) synthase DusA n=1 Tax=Rhodovulum sp. 12E13 TaxID=2203891 RepID=UPI000E15C5E4|nr:tRNA dihydrouridine(20/20a) synthase DusA [Rhodovulum sp. 12E13]RDC75416.1 tRNA dihydrouridine(20/20a) synthase DusA [Rhodovulum sp. 12E13]